MPRPCQKVLQAADRGVPWLLPGRAPASGCLRATQTTAAAASMAADNSHPAFRQFYLLPQYTPVGAAAACCPARIIYLRAASCAAPRLARPLDLLQLNVNNYGVDTAGQAVSPPVRRARLRRLRQFCRQLPRGGATQFEFLLVRAAQGQVVRAQQEKPVASTTSGSGVSAAGGAGARAAAQPVQQQAVPCEVRAVQC